MKKYLTSIVCALILPLSITAQQQTEYNKKGDEAMKLLDYSDARLFYGEGMPVCDMYSIQQLTTIWVANERMRTSMYNMMNQCLSCLSVKATENDTAAIASLIFYYTEGIGTSKSDELAAYWSERLHELTQPAESETVYAVQEKPKTPLRFFAGYTFSVSTPVGITLGCAGKRLGGYVRLKSNLSFQSNEKFTGNAPASIPSGTMLEAVDKKFNSYSATGGLMIRFKPVAFSVGAGYWKRDLLYKYEEVDDLGKGKGAYSWYEKADAPYKGLALEADAMVQFGRFYLTAGYSMMRFKEKFNQDLNAGIGVFF
jgi:hypothetical protein